MKIRTGAALAATLAVAAVPPPAGAAEPLYRDPGGPSPPASPTCSPA